MNKRARLTALALILVLALCLLPVSALAAANEEALPEEEEAVLTESPADGEDEADTREGTETDAPVEAEESEPPVTAEPAEDAPVFHCAVGESIYTTEGSLCYNDGGLVYNNAGTVYNNGGLVYNNAGLVYNNAGTVYSNGGTVYNNAGTVYSNGAQVYSHDGVDQDSALQGYDTVSMAGDYDTLAEIEGLQGDPQGGWRLAQEESCVIRPKAGITITEALVEGGELSEDGEGGYILTGRGEPILLSLRFQAQAPTIDLASGTYAEARTVELSAPEGLEIYYSVDGGEPTELYTEPLTVEEGLVLMAVAAASGAENSDLVQASYAVVQITGPEFEPVEVGYTRPAPQSIIVENLGTQEAKIEKVSLSGTDARRFYLSHSSGKTIDAGAVEETQWTVQPIEGLRSGEYSAVIVVTLAGGENIQLELTFVVNEAEE